MRKILLLALMFSCGQAWAEPYFRIFDFQHPQFNAGSLVDPFGGPTDMAVALPVVTHSRSDGYFIVPGEDWTPLAVGGGYNDSQILFSIGPSANVLPTMQIFAKTILDSITAPGKYKNLKDLLTPAPGSNSDVSFSVGPAFVYKPSATAHGKGYFRIFTGAAWRF